MQPLSVIVLAAGQGKRMRSELHKVLHPLCGQAMIVHVLRQVADLQPDEIFVVIGHDGAQVRAHLETMPDFSTLRFIEQKEQRGTGHAVMQVAPHISQRNGNVLVLNGDHPLITSATLRQVVQQHQRERAAMTILGAVLQEPRGYGRIVRGAQQEVVAIVEETDATEAQRELREVNTGTYLFATSTMGAALSQLTDANAQGEYYLPDLVGHLRRAGGRVGLFCLSSAAEAAGVNDRGQLAFAEQAMRQRIMAHHWERGVTILDPLRTYIEPGIQIGQDTVIAPDTYLRGRTSVGEGCQLGPGADLRDAWLSDRVEVRYAVLEGVRLATGVRVGPYAYLRPGTTIAEEGKVGAFVDLKNARLGARTRVAHLSYLGDAEVGADVNIGCGVVTVNYDGQQKHTTTLGDGAFIGCNTNLVAPVCVGRSAYVAAGSTVTEDVPEYALAIARARQVSKPGYARRWLGEDPK